MDITTVTTLLGSIKTATEIAKLIKDSDLSLEKAETKLKLAELIGALADAKLEGVELQQTLGEKDARIQELENQLQVREQLTWRHPSYWLQTPGGTDGPFCQQCYDTSHKLVRLQGDGDGYWECKACKNGYSEQERRDREDAAIRQHKRNPHTGVLKCLTQMLGPCVTSKCLRSRLLACTLRAPARARGA